MVNWVIDRVGPEGKTDYLYYGTGENGVNQVKSITGFTAGVSKTFTYDQYSRPTDVKDMVDGKTFIKTLTYDIYDNVKKVVYPSLIFIDNEYDANGYLKTIKNGTTTIFNGTERNNYGSWTKYTLGNGAASVNEFDVYGFPKNFKATKGAAVLQDLSFVFDQQRGNLKNRTDARKGKTEGFDYDNIDRLKTTQVTGLGTYSINYDNNGNISFKTDAGTYNYDANKIHAVSTIAGLNSKIPTLPQNITYTPYHQPATIQEGSYDLTYTYAADYERIKGVMKTNGAITNTRYYFGDYEQDITGATTRDIHYIGADGVNCIIEKVGSTTNFHYIYTDELC